MKRLLEKILNRETVSYVIVGVLTTAVDYIVFAIVNEALKRSGMDVTQSSSVATVVSWIAAVLFAYVTNKIYVFKSRERGFLPVLREMTSFFAARLISGGVVLFLMFILVDKCSMNEYIAKVLTSVFNLVFNYVASKLFIFKKKD